MPKGVGRLLIGLRIMSSKNHLVQSLKLIEHIVMYFVFRVNIIVYEYFF